jgi:hypothetical protein
MQEEDSLEFPPMRKITDDVPMKAERVIQESTERKSLYYKK